jgi:TorA maturation chaperone TorD
MPEVDTRTPGAADQVDRALARGILYEALALGFRPPDAETRRRLCVHESACALASAATFLDSDGKAELAGAALRLAAAPEAGAPAVLEASYQRLFGHTTRGSVSAYETEYGEDTAFQQPQQLSDVSGFLAAFGLQANPDQGRERVDHVSVECEFLAFLARKEAYAVEHREEPMLKETRRGIRLFLRDHLGRFAPALGRLLLREDPRGFYGALGDLCRRFVALECARLDVPCSPEFLPLRVPAEDTTPMACGTAEELIQIGGGAGSREEPPVPIRDVTGSGGEQG